MAFGKKSEARAKATRLPAGKFFAWKSSDVAIAANFVIVNSYLTMFCTDFLGMDPKVVGMVLLISNIIDAITDVVICYIVDNTHTRWGKGRPYEIGALGVWICTLAMFYTPGTWPQALKIAWLFFMYTFAFGVFNTARGGAQTPYMIRAFDNNRALIGKVSSYGGLVTTLGSMIVSVSFPMLMAKLATSPAGWRTLITIYGVPLLVLCLPRLLFVKENPNVDTGHQADHVSVKDIFRMFIKNKYAWFYAGIMLLYNVVTSLGVTSYYFKYVVGNTAIQGVMSIFSIILLPLMLLMPQLLKRWSAPQIFIGGCSLAVAGYAISFIARDNVSMLVAGGFLTALAMFPLSYLGSLIIMDLCTYNEYNGMARLDSSTTVLSNNLASQIGQGIGGAITGWVLSACGYVAAEGDAIVAQSETVVLAIRILYAIVPMVLMLGIAVCAHYLGKLNKRMPEIEETLAARKAAAEANSDAGVNLNVD